MPHHDHTAFVNSCRDERGLGHHTLRAYAQDLKTFAHYAERYELADPVSRDDILNYHRYLRNVAEAQPATIQRRLSTVRTYFAWCEDRNAALPSPFADLRISVRIPRRLPRPVDRQTLKAVLRTEHAITCAPSSTTPVARAFDLVTLLIIKLLIVTGLRISELTNLKVRDVSPDAGQIRVNGKGSKERIVFVPNRELLEDFQRYCEARCEQGGLASPLFLNAQGRRLRSATFRKRLRMLSKRLKIEPHLTPHRFRHSAATLLVEERVVAEFDGVVGDPEWVSSGDVTNIAKRTRRIVREHGLQDEDEEFYRLALDVGLNQWFGKSVREAVKQVRYPYADNLGELLPWWDKMDRSVAK